MYLTAVLCLVLTGLGVSIYLSVSHYRVYTDMGYASFCAISKAINCDTVSQSPYSIFWGIPVPIWGVIGYMFILATLSFSYERRSGNLNMFPGLVALGIIFSLISLWLGAISAINIQSYCIMCIITYGVNFLILYMFWLIKRRFDPADLRQSIRKTLSFIKANSARAPVHFVPILSGVILLRLFIPEYWHFHTAELTNSEIKTGITEEGSPWIGAEEPELTIIEYTDYMCFQCRKMHFFLRNLVILHPEKIRLVHRHFPMDKKFNPMLREDLHPGSGSLSSAAIHAAKANRFWEVNDILYHYNTDRGAIYLNEIADAARLELRALKTGIHKPDVTLKLQQDIISGLKLNISGTPSYVISGTVHTGQIPREILEPYLK